MNNSMMVYLNKRLHQNDLKYHLDKKSPGPVICISRLVGCSGLNIARQLAAELEKQTFCQKWRVISKEILLESALELNMDPNKLKSFLKDGDRGFFDDILDAFSERRFKSERRISKTLIDLISSFANDGYCIIVGRAGHIIARNIEQSLLVRLTAPLEWRINQIMHKNNLNRRDALEFINKTDSERENLRKHIARDVTQEDTFDLTIDLSRMSVPEVLSVIGHVAKDRGMLVTQKSKVEVF
jgi:cytidylate kinase